MSDFISDIQGLFADAISPDLFKLWSGISLIAGAMERRIWSTNRAGKTYASMYVLLVAPPGTGKGIVNQVRRLWTSTVKPGTKIPAFYVAPDSMTKAALIDTLAESKTTFLPKSGPPFSYTSLNIAAEEFGVLLPAYDLEYVNTLNSIWNNDESHSESRRYGKKQKIIIEHPQLNIIAGTQPAYMAAIFPEEAWNTGLARRLMMIYSAEKLDYDLFSIALNVDTESYRERVLAKLSRVSGMWGEMTWTSEAIAAFRDWRASGEAPMPTHSKLVHYNTTRSLYMFKLAMISSICRDESMSISLVDFARAKAWLTLAESFMPDVFRAMIGKSDKDVIDELHRYAMGMYATSRKPVDGMDLRRFMMERVPHEKIEGILLVADRAGLIVRTIQPDGSEKYVPKMRQGLGGRE